MPFQIQPQEKVNVLVLSEDFTIAHAAELHAALLPLAIEDKPIAIETQAVTSIHTSIVQLLFSLKQSVPQFELRSVSPAFVGAVERLGLKTTLTSSAAKP